MCKNTATALFTFLFLLPAILSAGEYRAPSPEPTPIETLMVEYMNRFRADPKAEANRIAPPGPKKGRRGVDLGMFRKETSALPKAPPVVINLNLLKAARKHSHYQILNGMTHTQSPGKPGFTGKSFGERCKKAGYQGRPRSENCFRDARGAWVAHSGFIVDAGPDGPGGMQPGRGHRRNMADPGVREVGCSGLPHSGRLCVTHDFGVQSTRFAGGVVYVDSDGDGFYSIGEGVGGVTIAASDGSVVQTWASGAYTLPLKSSRAVTLKATSMGILHSQQIPDGKTNVKFDWIINPKALADHADKLIAKVEQIPAENEGPRRKAAINMLLGTQGLPLADEQRTRIAKLAGSAGEELRSCQQAVLTALKDYDAQAFPKVISEKSQAFSGTPAASWFSEASLLGKVKKQVLALEANAKRQKISPAVKRPFIKQLDMLGLRLKETVFLAELNSLKSRAESAGQ